MKKKNEFDGFFQLLNKISLSHSDTPAKRETEKIEKRLNTKSLRPNHSRILMRDKSQDEFEKVSKEVKFKSFISLDEYGKSNSATGKFGVTKDASVTKFKKKKTAQNLKSYIPTCGYEIEINSPEYISTMGDIRNFRKLMNSSNEIYEDIPEDYIEDRLNGVYSMALFTPTVDNLKEYQENIINHRNIEYLNDEELRNRILKLINKLNNNTLNDNEYQEIIDIAFDINSLNRLESVLYGKEYNYVMSSLKEIYTTHDCDLKSLEVDSIYGIEENIIPLVRNQTALKPYQKKHISNLIKKLTTYSAHETIRYKFCEAFVYMMSTCIRDKEEDTTLEKLFDSFTMIVPPQYQAMVMASISIISRDDADKIGEINLGEITNFLRNYIEVLPTKVETLFMYLDEKFMINDGDVDILNLLPLKDWQKQQYPAIYAMLKEIGKKSRQYASLFNDSDL